MDNPESKTNELSIDSVLKKLHQFKDFDKLSKVHSDYINEIMISDEGYRLFFTGLKYSYEKDINHAISLYEKAVNLGNSKAMNNLANCYKNGEGVEKDINYAIELHEKAMNLGNSNAMYNLSLCYEFNKNIEKNIPKAIELLEKAIKLDNNNKIFHKNFQRLIEKISFRIYSIFTI